MSRLSVFVLDNYDSFTFNLVQQMGELGCDVYVARNDDVSVADVEAAAPGAVVISPGPGAPADAGVCVELVGWCASTRTPLLGVCLGHQAIAVAFGGRVSHAPEIVHGKTSEIFHAGAGTLRGLPNPFEAMRYHSLAIDRLSLPKELVVTAWTNDGIVMGLRHIDLPIEGVQFHPESILSPDGKKLMANFVGSAYSPTVISTVSPRRTIVPGAGF